MIRRPPRSTQSRSSAASDVYKRQIGNILDSHGRYGIGHNDWHGKGCIEFQEAVTRLCVRHSDDDTLWMQRIPDRHALAQELWVDGKGQFLGFCNTFHLSLKNGECGGRYRALDHDN